MASAYLKLLDRDRFLPADFIEGLSASASALHFFSLQFLFPISIVFGPAGGPIFVVVGVRHLHAVLYTFFAFPAMNLAPFVLGPGIRARSGIPKILKSPCRRTGRVSSLCCRSIGHTAVRFAGALLVLGTFLFQGRGQSNHNLVVVGSLFVALASRLVVCVESYHIHNEGAGLEG